MTVLTRGEVEFGAAFEDGELHLHFHDHADDIEHEADGVLLHVPALAQSVVPDNPAYSFFGSAGAPVWILPQVENPKLLFLGVVAEEIDSGVFVNDSVDLKLPGVEGRGDLFLYSIDGIGQPVVAWNSADGIDAKNMRRVSASGHEHVNWAFTSPGIYHVRCRRVVY